jgi:hypothetical protein
MLDLQIEKAKEEGNDDMANYLAAGKEQVAAQGSNIMGSM